MESRWNLTEYASALRQTLERYGIPTLDADLDIDLDRLRDGITATGAQLAKSMAAMLASTGSGAAALPKFVTPDGKTISDIVGFLRAAKDATVYIARKGGAFVVTVSPAVGITRRGHRHGGRGLGDQGAAQQHAAESQQPPAP
jgi:hypothetical protein